MRKKFWPENLKGRDCLEELGIDGKITEFVLVQYCGKAWTGFIRLRTGTSGGLF
jgi:hypothetical protein